MVTSVTRDTVGSLVGATDRLDVVAAAGDEAGNARERAGFILKEYCYEMPHGPTSIREGGTWAPGRELLVFHGERPLRHVKSSRAPARGRRHDGRGYDGAGP